MRRWRVAGLALVYALLLAGCGFGEFLDEAPEVPLELDYNRLLPVGWEPITQWYEVNIDGDPAIEYLLLFTYDSGQVGAVIYDQQVSTDLTAPVNEDDAGARRGPPLQAFGYYRPYLLLPSNWDYTYGGAVSHGFVAQPRDADNIVVSQVVRAGNTIVDALQAGDSQGAEETEQAELAEQADGADETRPVTHPRAEVVVQGGSTHLTFVWWKNRQEGYGVTQLYAPGGFRGIAWDTWRESPTPINEISGLFPLTDYRARSLLCQETAYMRQLAEASIARVGGGVESPREEAVPTPGASPIAVPVLPPAGTSAGTPAVTEGVAEATDGAAETPTANGDAGENLESDAATPTAPATSMTPTAASTAETNGNTQVDRPVIAFGGRNLGIHFCTPNLPAHPFYPEGVTLLYLLTSRDAATDATTEAGERLLTAGVSRGLLDETLDAARLAGERVNDIEAFPTVPVAPETVQAGAFAPTTSVCVELAARADPTQRRWLLFTLRYHAPDMEARTPERWTLSGVAQQPPPPVARATGYCRAILGLE